MTKTWRLPAAVLLSIVTGCSDSVTQPSIKIPEVLASSVQPTRHPLVFRASVTLDTAGAAVVSYHTASGPVLSVESDTDSLSHAVLLTQLTPSTTYTYEVTARSRDGRTGATVAGGTFVTGALPAGLDADEFTATGTPTLPLTLVQISTATNGWFGVVAFNASGIPVWFHRTTTGAMGFTRLSNGNIAIVDRGIVIVGAEGDTVAALPQIPGVQYGTIHHGIAERAPGDILFIATDTRIVSDTSVVGDAIWEWMPATGVLTKRWSSFDFMDWKTERTTASGSSDWLHANAVSQGAHGNTIVGFRNLNQVISIAPDWKSVEWRLGGPGSTLSLPEDALFFGQHGAHEISPNHILMFDNGFGRSNGETFSRAMEVEVDPDTHTADKVWEYRATPDLFDTRLGSVKRYGNGNTLIDFGWQEPSPIQIIEVTPDGQTAFRLAPANAIPSKIYGVESTQTLFGETTH